MTVSEYKELIKNCKDHPDSIGLFLGKMEQEIEKDFAHVSDLEKTISEQESKIKDMGYQLWVSAQGEPEKKADDANQEDDEEDSFDKLLSEIKGGEE